MLSEQVAGDWNFAPVHDFLRSTSLAGRPSLPVSLVAHSQADQYDAASHLGDFGKIWEYLGQPLNVPPPTVQLLPYDATITTTREDIEPKAASYSFPKGKGVRWRDELEGAEPTNNDVYAHSEAIPLSKESRRKKARRRNELNSLEKNNQKVLPSGSENESENDVWTPERSQARKAIIHRVLHDTLAKADHEASSLLRPLRGPQLPINLMTWPAASVRILAPPEKPSVSQEETAYAAAAEKKVRLMAKLCDKFVEEKQYLNDIGLASNTASGDSRTDVGVHVFVDASNV